MNKNADDSPAPTCPHCGSIQDGQTVYCPRCGARLSPLETAPRLRLSFFFLLFSLPAIALVALGSCAATLAIGAGIVTLNWKLVAGGMGALLLCWLIARLAQSH